LKLNPCTKSKKIKHNPAKYAGREDTK
jgi:hypothetical protein